MNSHIMAEYKLTIVHHPEYNNVLTMMPISNLNCVCIESARNPEQSHKLQLPIHQYYRVQFEGNAITLAPIPKQVYYCPRCVEPSTTVEVNAPSDEKDSRKGKRVSKIYLHKISTGKSTANSSLFSRLVIRKGNRLISHSSPRRRHRRHRHRRSKPLKIYNKKGLKQLP